MAGTLRHAIIIMELMNDYSYKIISSLISYLIGPKHLQGTSHYWPFRGTIICYNNIICYDIICNHVFLLFHITILRFVSFNRKTEYYYFKSVWWTLTWRLHCRIREAFQSECQPRLQCHCHRSCHHGVPCVQSWSAHPATPTSNISGLYLLNYYRKHPDLHLFIYNSKHSKLHFLISCLF